MLRDVNSFGNYIVHHSTDDVYHHKADSQTHTQCLAHRSERRRRASLIRAAEVLEASRSLGAKDLEDGYLKSPAHSKYSLLLQAWTL